MHKFIILIIFSFSVTSQARELSYTEFTLGNSFSPIDDSYLMLEAKCRKSYDQRNQKKYYESRVPGPPGAQINIQEGRYEEDPQGRFCSWARQLGSGLLGIFLVVLSSATVDPLCPCSFNSC